MPPRTPLPRPYGNARAPETVDPKWLLKAFGLVVAVALLMGYATLCLLFYQGQWQLILHPGAAPHPGAQQSGTVPADAQITHFGPDATATPQLIGWWIPAAARAPYRHLTLLYLRGGDGSLRDDMAALNALHAAGLNLLAFDYLGFPATSSRHPTEQHMTEDTEAAWQYLLADKHIVPQTIIPYGIGVGASLAVHLAGEHREIPAVILDAPAGDLLDSALRSPTGYLVPVRLLFRERFPLQDPLVKLATPKLILSRGSTEAPVARRAADPKFTVDLPPTSSPAAFQTALSRFLDQYLPPPALSEAEPGNGSLERLPSEPLK